MHTKSTCLWGYSLTSFFLSLGSSFADAYDLTAEDLYSKKKSKGRPAEKRDGVKSEVLRLLGDGEPMVSSELEEKVCEVTGCHVNTLAAVKKELGVESYQSGRQWFSVLRGQNTKKAQVSKSL